MTILTTLIFIAGMARMMYLDTEQIIHPDMCHGNSGSGTYEKINELKIKLPECLHQQRAKYIAKKEIFAFNNDERDLQYFFRKTCLQQNDDNTCYNPLISAAKQCMNETEIQIIESLEQLDKDLLNYICNNKDEVTKYIYNMDDNCQLGISEVENKCLNLTNNPFNTMFSSLSCTRYNEAEECIMNTLSNRCSQDIIDVVTTLIKILKTNTCRPEPKMLQTKLKSLNRIRRQAAMTHKMEKIEGHVTNLCIKEGHESKKLKDTLDKMKSCIDEKELFAVPKHVYIKHVDGCTKDAITLFKSCLPEKYKYIPQLLFDIIDAVTSYLYDDFIIIESELTPCLPKLESEESDGQYNDCVDKIMEGVDDELVDSKTKFCERFIPLNECFVTQLKKECKESPELTRIEDDLMKAVKKPCDVK